MTRHDQADSSIITIPTDVIAPIRNSLIHSLPTRLPAKHGIASLYSSVVSSWIYFQCLLALTRTVIPGFADSLSNRKRPWCHDSWIFKCSSHWRHLLVCQITNHVIPVFSLWEDFICGCIQLSWWHGDDDVELKIYFWKMFRPWNIIYKMLCLLMYFSLHFICHPSGQDCV